MLRSAKRGRECEDSEEQRSIREIYVEGYDGNLEKPVLEEMMRNYFKSCGEITKIDFNSEIVGRCAIISIRGKRAEEEAVRRTGSDAGGWTVIVSRAKPSKEDLDGWGWDPETDKHRTVCVTGYDTSLPREAIEAKLTEYFSSCGEVESVTVPGDGNGGRNRKALLNIYGEGAVEKVEKLCGSDKEEIQVVWVMPPLAEANWRGMSSR